MRQYTDKTEEGLRAGVTGSGRKLMEIIVSTFDKYEVEDGSDI